MEKPQYGKPKKTKRKLLKWGHGALPATQGGQPAGSLPVGPATGECRGKAKKNPRAREDSSVSFRCLPAPTHNTPHGEMVWRAWFGTFRCHAAGAGSGGHTPPLRLRPRVQTMARQTTSPWGQRCMQLPLEDHLSSEILRPWSYRVCGLTASSPLPQPQRQTSGR